MCNPGHRSAGHHDIVSLSRHRIQEPVHIINDIKRRTIGKMPMRCDQRVMMRGDAQTALLLGNTCGKYVAPDTGKNCRVQIRSSALQPAHDGGLSSWSDSCAAIFCSSHTSGNFKTSFQKRNDLIIQAVECRAKFGQLVSHQ